VVPRGGVFLGKWHSSFAGNFDGKMNVQSACALNSRYIRIRRKVVMNLKMLIHHSMSENNIMRNLGQDKQQAGKESYPLSP
jgi:hypothetical protein